MGKIKGWKKDKHIGSLTGWKTPKRPFLSIWIYNDNQYWIVENDFRTPRKIFYKTKQDAVNSAIKYMKSHPNG